jgi:hypothetical protein
LTGLKATRFTEVPSLAANTFVLSLIVSGTTAQAELERADVRINNGEVILAGTIILPSGGGPFPGLVFVHGSGPGERSDLYEVATGFAAAGMAVLIYDKRGSGSSGGNWITSSLTDLAMDAAAAYRHLVAQPKVDLQRSGFWGISQGGWVVPLASNMVSPAFAIVVTGGGLAPHEIETVGYRAILNNNAYSKKAADDSDVLIQNYFDYLSGSISHEILMGIVDRFRSEAWFKAMGIERVIPGPENRRNWEWVATFKPEHSIQNLAVPVLVLLGAKDPLVPARDTARAWRESLTTEVAGNRVIVFDDAGHGLRTDGHGGSFIAEYFSTQIDWLRAIGVLANGSAK